MKVQLARDISTIITLKFDCPARSMDGVQGYGYSKHLQRFITSTIDGEVPRPWWDTDLGQKPPLSKRSSLAQCSVCSKPGPHRCGGCKASRYWYGHQLNKLHI
jgi:hypothetical protein